MLTSAIAPSVVLPKSCFVHFYSINTLSMFDFVATLLHDCQLSFMASYKVPHQYGNLLVVDESKNTSFIFFSVYVVNFQLVSLDIIK